MSSYLIGLQDTLSWLSSLPVWPISNSLLNKTELDERQGDMEPVPEYSRPSQNYLSFTTLSVLFPILFLLYYVNMVNVNIITNGNSCFVCRYTTCTHPIIYKKYHTKCYPVKPDYSVIRVAKCVICKLGNPIITSLAAASYVHILYFRFQTSKISGSNKLADCYH